MKDEELIRIAIEARNNAYSPYSGYCVGAALLTEDGNVYKGCNIENASYTPTICAERTAIYNAVSKGESAFSKIAIVGSPKGEITQYAFPCGVCRQVMMEFFNPKTTDILVAMNEKEYKKYTLEELLPNGFGADNLSKNV